MGHPALVAGQANWLSPLHPSVTAAAPAANVGCPICPDFLWRFVALIHSMRLSLMKGAHAGLSSAAWQEIGVKPSFGLSGIPELDVPLPVPHARPRQSEGYDPRSWLSPCDGSDPT